MLAVLAEERGLGGCWKMGHSLLWIFTSEDFIEKREISGGLLVGKELSGNCSERI